MIVTRLEELEQSKVKVYIDDEYAFLLYQKDINHFKLSEGVEISPELYNEILEDTIYRRAQQKALSILKFMDRTEQELRRKLLDAGYPDMIADRAIAYVVSYDYLNDERFAAAFARSRMKTKSKLVIRTELLQKGIAREIVDKILKEEYADEEQEDVELNAIRKAVAKRTLSPEALSYEEKQKLIASLYRKGFEISKIKQVLD